MASKSPLILYALAVLLAFAVVYTLFERYRKQYKLSPAFVLSSFWALAGAGFLLVLILTGSASQQQLVHNLLAAMVGATLGWLLGMYISPIGTSEATAFHKYSTALAGVFSGYTLKSLVDFLASSDRRQFLLGHAVPLCLLAISFLLSMAAVYSSRAYDNKILEIHLDGAKPEYIEDRIKLLAATPRTFFAEVVGPSNPAVRWSIERIDPIPSAVPPTVSDTGVFLSATPLTCRLTAISLEDPSLANFIDLTVV